MNRSLVVALSGGIGGAKLALGLSRILPAEEPRAVGGVAQLSEPAEIALAGVVGDIEKAMNGREGDLAHLFAVSGGLPEAVEEFFEDIAGCCDAGGVGVFVGGVGSERREEAEKRENCSLTGNGDRWRQEREGRSSFQRIYELQSR